MGAALRLALAGVLPEVAVATFTHTDAHGNDFLLVDAAAVPEQARWPALARRVCDRATGIGADGLIFVTENAAGAAGLGSGPGRIRTADCSILSREPHSAGSLGRRCRSLESNQFVIVYETIAITEWLDLQVEVGGFEPPQRR